YRNLQAGTAGQFYYIESLASDNAFGPAPEKTTLHQYDLAKRKDEPFMSDVSTYVLSVDKKKLLYGTNNSWGIVPTVGKVQPGQGKINVDAIEVRIDPPAEWAQIFNEAWRINRDYF